MKGRLEIDNLLSSYNNNIMVIDTEASNGINTPLVYDIGYIVYNLKTGNIVKQSQLIISEVFNNKALMDTAYYKEKIPKYVELLNNKQVDMVTLECAMNEIKRVLGIYNIKHVYAFNSSFDIKALKFTCDFYNVYNPLDVDNLITKVTWHDIQWYIRPLVNSDNYKKYCEHFHKVTNSQRFYNVNAETVYGYITKNPKYIEEHTALADAKIELTILLYCVYGYDLNIFKGEQSSNNFVKRDKDLTKVKITFADGSVKYAYYERMTYNSQGTLEFIID